MKNFATFFFVITALSFNAHAFDPDKCGELFPKSGDAHRPYWAPAYSTTIVPSVTSYFLSFGKCSMYGSRDVRLSFITQTYDQIALEAAIGKGEYVIALAALSGCNQQSTNQFSHVLHTNYQRVFANSGTIDVAAVATQMDQLVHSDPFLSKNCLMID